ncbi:MAG: hypothetical protein ACYDEN_02925, partial [Acidimicrobiales bacterium]
SRRTQDGFDEHAAFMDALVDEGTILLGGPVGDETPETHFWSWLATTRPQYAPPSPLSGDPWLGTVLTITSVQLWSLWLRSAAV